MTSLAINEIHEGDCLELMKGIPTGSIDMILCDLPYGTTACKWDTVIPFDALWAHYERVIKDKGAIVLTASQPFTSALIMSNPKLFKYSLVWEKTKAANFMQASFQFLKIHEDIIVFSKGGASNGSKSPMLYNPQGTKNTLKRYKNSVSQGGEVTSNHGKSLSVGNEYTQTKTNFPNSILRFANDTTRHHPTQKPVALFEYLIHTYTNAGDTVLDNCIGSGTTAIAAINTNRNYIGIEQDAGYVEIARTRIAEHNGGKRS